MKTALIDRFINADGAVTTWPKKHSAKEAVLAYLASKFAFDASYGESEVNEILKHWHTFQDWPLLRRELFEHGYLYRNSNGSNYRRLK